MKHPSRAVLTLLAFSVSPTWSATTTPDYSKEALVIQKLTTKVAFSADGTREWQQTMSVRLQSEAAVRQLGVLSLSYEAGSEQAQVDYVRVRKPNGSIVETPASSVQDVATEVATVAPTYSDLRQKQIPVKSLGVGDVLEYSFRSSQKSAEVPGQFWYSQYPVDDGVVLDETLEVTLPRDKFVLVISPKLNFETRTDGDKIIYSWHHNHLETSKPEGKKKQVSDSDAPVVQITSFKNWEEVGAWWSAIAAPQAAVTPAIQSKANELTAGLKSDADKEQAIYKYVAMKFRYISISLGAGKYKPHSAADVLTNQYGDCKDKHTLFTALLKAAGIQAWPALMGAGIKFDANVPSPAQFNHVITVLPREGKYVWLDTTAEVAPFGMLSQDIRDEEALVIPMHAKPLLMKTPLNPPFLVSNKVEVKSSLAADGTLTGQFDFQLMGDAALAIRGAFRQLAPAQWQPLVQQLAYSIGFAGDVSSVEAEGVEDLDKPFHYSYDYNRKNYSDWAEHKITPPIPPMGFGPGEDADKPTDPFWAGEAGTYTYRASVQIPKGFSAELPENKTLASEFAVYTSHYSIKDGVLTAERTLQIKQAKVSVAEWDAYRKFIKGVSDDQTTYTSLTEAESGALDISDANPEIFDLERRTHDAMMAHNWSETRDLLDQVKRLNPKQQGLWSMLGYLEMVQNRRQDAIEDCRKEIEYHPSELAAHYALAQALLADNKRTEAAEAWRGALAVQPDDETAALNLGRLLIELKKYDEVPAVMEKAIAAWPEKYNLQAVRAEAMLRDGHKQEGLAEAKRIAAATSEPMLLNDLAYYVSDTDADDGSAKAWAEKSVAASEETAGKADLKKLSQTDLAAVSSLAASWDTLGWIDFKNNDIAGAEKYVTAAWKLGEGSEVADHLGQIYAKQGRQKDAIHMWRLALAANSPSEDARERLRKAGTPVEAPITKPVPEPPTEELGTMRNIGVPALSKTSGSGEFLILVSKTGIEEVKPVRAEEDFDQAQPALQAAKYEFPFPDNGPEKLVRRGILSCSTYTKPNCEFTMLLPAGTTLADVKTQEADTQPTLLSKVEPEYSKAAMDAKVEGEVRLSVIVNADGIPEDISVVKPLGSGLDEKAVECVKKWRFVPGTKDGKPVRVNATMAINFKLVKPPSPEN